MRAFNLDAYLDHLESEAIYIIREAVAQFDKLAILFSGGKDSAVLAHLACKALWPKKWVFPLLHIDTGHNFLETLEFRDAFVSRFQFNLHIREVKDTIAKGYVLEEKGVNASRNALQSVTLLQAIKEFEFDALLCGGRRDEEKSRAKERLFSHRNEFGQWNSCSQRPEFWMLLNGRKQPQEHFRVFPISNWTEVDIWHYIRRENIPFPSLYFSHQRDVIYRNKNFLAVTPHITISPSETVMNMHVRFRTVGDATCTGVIESHATDVDAIIAEIESIAISERSVRIDDKRSNNALEDRKRDGYF